MLIPKPVYFVGEFTMELIRQLISDDQRWGQTWLKRPRKGQERRIVDRINEYMAEWERKTANNENVAFPWVRGAGLMVIGWVRDRYPAISSAWGGKPTVEKRWINEESWPMIIRYREALVRADRMLWEDDKATAHEIIKNALMPEVDNVE